MQENNSLKSNAPFDSIWRKDAMQNAVKENNLQKHPEALFDAVWKKDITLTKINPAQSHRRRLVSYLVWIKSGKIELYFITQMDDFKLTKEQKYKYVVICELTWGCVPIDVDWAIGTNIYKDMETKLILSGVIKLEPVI
mgnify:CR=1 FL=1